MQNCARQSDVRVCGGGGGCGARSYVYAVRGRTNVCVWVFYVDARAGCQTAEGCTLTSSSSLRVACGVHAQMQIVERAG